MKKLFGSCLCSAILIICFLIPAYASTQRNQSGLVISTAEQNEPLDLDILQGTLVEAPQTYEMEKQPEAKEILDISDELFTEKILQNEDANATINLGERSGNQDFYFSGVIDQPNGQYNIFPITLYNDQNIHAELIGPSNSNLNYDLRLYEMDINTGALTALVDICSYGKDANATVLPQTVSTLNESGGVKNYALIVYALSGYSSVDTFDVNITLGIGGDPAESNDNAFTAYSLGELGVNGLVITGTTLDSPKDVDWFVFSVPDMKDFNKMKIENGENSKVKFQLYRVGSGTSLVEIKPTNGFYSLQGVNYLRVIDEGNNFSSGDIPYQISATVSFKLARTLNEIRMNGVLDLPTQTYKVWNESETSYWPEKRTAILGETVRKPLC